MLTRKGRLTWILSRQEQQEAQPEAIQRSAAGKPSRRRQTKGTVLKTKNGSKGKQQEMPTSLQQGQKQATKQEKIVFYTE